MIIRQAQECDRHGLIILLEEAFSKYISPSQEAFDKYLMTPNQYTFVGIIDNKIVATQTITIEHKMIHSYGKVAHSEDLAVKAGYQGRGLAAKMMDYCIEVCRQKGVYKLIATCTEDKVEYYSKNLGTHQHEVGIRRDF